MGWGEREREDERSRPLRHQPLSAELDAVGLVLMTLKLGPEPKPRV